MTGQKGNSPKRKASKISSKRGLGALGLGPKANLGLAVDTSVSRHHGGLPQQVFPAEPTTADRFPYESRTQDYRKVKTKTTGLKAQLENREPMWSAPRHEPQSMVNPSQLGLPTRPDAHRNLSIANADSRLNGHEIPAQALHKRIKGLRPSPLDLADVSPSDRAITIGIALPSAAMTAQTSSPLCGAGQSSSPGNQALEALTPTIIITPARETFDQATSSGYSHSNSALRPTSSVYSGAPRTAGFEATPPVPPLPLFAIKSRTRMVKEPTTTVFEDHSAGVRSHKATLSVCTVFEEEDDDNSASQLQSAKSLHRQISRRMTSQSMLLTPRRSRGWWNLLTSPFSARPGAMFWRSPTQASPDNTAILSDVSAMGFSKKVPMFTSCGLDDQELRSAPVGDDVTMVQSCNHREPKRSVTAPGALDANALGFNIYRVPSQGEAAAYYDQSKHFPSLYLGSSETLPKSFLEEYSPLTDMGTCERHDHGAAKDLSSSSARGSRNSVFRSGVTAECACEADRDMKADDLASPFSDAHALEITGSLDPPQCSIFTSPTADELKTATPERTKDRSLTQATVESHFSPLSATPVVKNAHMATLIGPQSTNGEPRAIVVTPSRPGSACGDSSTAAAVTTSRDFDIAPNHLEPAPAMAELSQRPVYHARSESYGLGISDGEKDLFPPPKLLSEKPRLETDRWGQLRIIIPKDEIPERPWYRRFIWLIISIITFMLMLLVVLLVMLITQKHPDMPVQGQWLNLTGFPPLPTGITTVVQPNKVRQESGCVNPTSLWSCAVPQVQQSSSSLSSTEQPNFRFEFRFLNASSNNLNATALEPQSKKRSRGALLQARSIWSEALFSTSPVVPSKDEQAYLGQTTDNITAPYGGEETPFFLSLLDAVAISNLYKRQESPYPYPTTDLPSNSTTGQGSSARNASTKATESIPKPALQADGEPMPATLYPLAQAQPLRLYNRGSEDEHYGFYTYFDRSIYVAKMTSSQSSPSDANTALKNASAVCTWSQTRFHVQIWTRKSTSLLSASKSGDSSTAAILPMSNGTNAAGIPARNSTANEIAQPGSFPHPVTITLDRHGGNAAKKGLYCYGINDDQQVTDASLWVAEDRSFAGALLNPADVPGANTAVANKRSDEVAGGIDGGTGGCSCGWQNWT